VDYDDFQIAVIDLASTGTRLTVANIVAELGVKPSRAEPWLDQMARDGRVDVEVDELEGAVVYRVRGLTPRARRPAASSKASVDFGALDLGQVGRSLGLAQRPRPGLRQRDVRIGALLGGLFPGLGLAYAAPWSIAAIAAIGVWIGFKVLAAVSLFFFGIPFIIAAAAVSAVLGAVYAHRFNQEGHRARLLGEDPPPRLRR
jgi:xanthosine utilization system XapX-like protein